jgi:ABC-2 type transport system permease protein
MNLPSLTTDRPNRARPFHPYVAETKYAFLRFLRNPAFSIPTLAFPVLFFFLIGFMFGAFKAKSTHIDVPTYVFCGFVTMAAMTPGIFGFGIGHAQEREQGLLTLKRALPMPPLASLIGAVNMSILATMLATLLLSVAAFVAGVVNLSLAQFAGVIATASLGAIPFCALGLLIGMLTSGRAAPAVANIVFLIFLYFSGLFVQLPKAIESVVTASPAFYLHQLTLAAAGSKNFMINGPLMHVAILLGVTVVCLGLATRRLERQG